MKIKSLNIDAYGCQCDLNDSKLLLSTLVNAAKSINAKIVKKVVYHYKPHGVSVIVLLAETHASIFTWPEYKYAAVEIFLCNESMNPYKFWEIVKEVLKPQRFEIKETVRDIG